MVRGGRGGKAKTARISTGGHSRGRGARRTRETARKSTGGLGPRMNLAPRMNLVSDNNDVESESETSDEAPSSGVPQAQAQLFSRFLNLVGSAGATSTSQRNNGNTRPASSTVPSSNNGGDTGGHDSSSTRAIPWNQADRLVTGLPVLVHWSGTASSRNEEALNAAAVETAVGALKTANAMHSRVSSVIQKFMDDNPPKATASADSSTNSSTANAPTCEASSSQTDAQFVLPPAVPGHSRWAIAEDNLNTNTTTTTDSQTPPSLPAPRRKKKHFTPLPFSEPSSKIPRRNSGSEENPFVVNESESNDNSLTFNSKFDAKKVKQAFAHFQSIRQILTDSRACSRMNGFVHLNAVEQMLIKCYQYAKKGRNSLDTSNPPVIVLDDSNEINTDVNNLLINPLSTSTQTDIKVLDLSNVAKMTSGSPESHPSQLDSNRSSSAEINHRSSSSSGSTTSLTGTGTGVARKRATIVPPPATATTETSTITERPSLFAIKTELVSTAQSGSSSRNSTTTLDHIDEAINAVVGVSGGSTGSGARDAGNSRPTPYITNADLLAQMSDAQKETLNTLVCMGFGGEEEAVFNQLLNTVRDNNGNLGACLDRLTR